LKERFVSPYLVLVLLLYIFKEAFEYIVRYLNLKHMQKAGLAVPQEFEGKIDQALMKKTRDYETEKTYFGFVSSVFGNIVTIIFIFGGLLNVYNSWITSLHLSFVVSGWLFFLFLSYGSEILSMPFSLYSTFKIENRYGFNTMTVRLWISDFLKSLLISTIMLTLVAFAGLLLIQFSPRYWWLWVWAFLLVFGIFVMYISPYVIEPLFNKFTPVADESLRERIVELTEKAGIHARRILRVDASKRSRHTNAYFTGIGKTKRIVLYDTLLEGMNHEEILSVLAHEIGHWKKRHLLKTMAVIEVFSLSALYVSYRLVQGDFLTGLFRLSQGTLFAKLILLAFIGGILSVALTPFMSALSRKHEREADRISYELAGDEQAMVGAFVKLSKENLSNLYPHPLYVTMYYSHPPILERIRYIREMGKSGQAESGDLLSGQV
jgi:STE24 endopeptidase